MDFTKIDKWGDYVDYMVMLDYLYGFTKSQDTEIKVSARKAMLDLLNDLHEINENYNKEINGKEGKKT